MNDDYTPVPVDAPIVTPGQNCWQIGEFYVTAQPTDPLGLETANGLGIQSVVCLRDSAETANPPYLPFDFSEDMTLTTLGMNYVDIPIPHEISQTQFDVRAGVVLAALERLPQPLLMHCSSGDRASALWAVHLIVDCGLSTADAILYAEMSGLDAFIPFVENYQSA
jgi:protein tyrosine phosphatase (PTP) superfamily phosphohydrolase (DUF442 family)